MDKRMYDWMDDQKKGKKNKLRVGDKVRAKPSWVDWHSSHIAWLLADAS